MAPDRARSVDLGAPLGSEPLAGRPHSAFLRRAFRVAISGYSCGSSFCSGSCTSGPEPPYCAARLADPRGRPASAGRIETRLRHVYRAILIVVPFPTMPFTIGKIM